MSRESEFSVNEDGKLCRKVISSICINRYSNTVREPVVVQFFINGLKAEGQDVNFIYNRVYVNDKIGW
jgi:hypothetical protein